MLKTNTNNKILTPEGLSSFSGINKVDKTGFVELWTKSHYLKCSLTHPIKTRGDEWIEAQHLKHDIEIQTKDGCEKIDDIFIDIETITTFYEPVNVEKNNEYYSNGIVSHNCAIFMGSEGSLISPSVLSSIKTIEPLQIAENGALQVFKYPEKGHNYMITVDTPRGKGIDNSAFIVLDITQYTIEVCATYSDPNVNSVLYPSYINRLGRLYNNAAVLVEINDNGQQVADILFDEYEYENLLGCLVTKGRMGQQLTTFGMRSKGIKTSEATKRVGCANLRSLIETGKIELNAHAIKAELSNFIKHNNSFAAQKGMHDDLVMCLVIFAWVTQQKYFQEFIQKGVKDVYRDQLEEIEYNMLPLGFMDDGSSPYIEIDDDGMIF